MRYVSLSILIVFWALVSCRPVAPQSGEVTNPLSTTTAAATTPMTTTDPLTMTQPLTESAPITAPIASEVGSCVWRATHSLQASGSAQLRVSGVCTMPTPGYTLTLTRAEPQGMNPNRLLLTLMAAAPTDMVAQVLAPAEVVYEETTDQLYAQVDITSQTDLVLGASVTVEEGN